MAESFWRASGLRINELKLMPRPHFQVGAGLRAHAYPVEVLGWLDRSVGFDSDLEFPVMKGGSQCWVHLQKRLPAGQHDEPPLNGAIPNPGYRLGEHLSGGIAATHSSVESDKIGVAEAAYGVSSILSSSRPQIAASKPAKDGGPSGLSALALESLEDLFDRVAHAIAFMGARRRTSRTR